MNRLDHQGAGSRPLVLRLEQPDDAPLLQSQRKQQKNSLVIQEHSQSIIACRSSRPVYRTEQVIVTKPRDRSCPYYKCWQPGHVSASSDDA